MIRARGLTRHFRTKRDGFTGGRETVEAVRGIDLDVAAGELVALLGPNGAGKSTTFRMLTTLLPPTSGEAVVASHDVAREPAAVRRRIGYVGQGNSGGPHHRVRDELLTQGAAYGLKRAAQAERADELLATLELTDLAKRNGETLSGGQRRRLDIALGLVHRPTLLFLDEPSTGLDPQNRANLWHHVLRIRDDFDTTVFLTTHYLEEADTMAERILVIDHGAIIAEGTPERLKADLAGDLLTLTAAGPEDAARVAAGAERVDRAHEVTVDGEVVRVRVPAGDAVLPGLLRTLDADGVHVARAEVRRPTLDDVFLHLTGRRLRDAHATEPDDGPADPAPAGAAPGPPTPSEVTR